MLDPAVSRARHRTAYRRARRAWQRARQREQEAANALARATHEALELYSAQTLAEWVSTDEEAVGEYSIRHWDVRHHDAHGIPRGHPIHKPTREGAQA